MKHGKIRIVSLLLLISLALLLASCTAEEPLTYDTNETISTEETNEIETTEAVTTKEPRPTMNNPKVYYVEGRRYEIFYNDRGGRSYISYDRIDSEDSKAFEIVLPADGETIKYDTPLVIYESPEGEKIAFESVSNSGGNITFQGVKSDIIGQIQLYSPDACYIGVRGNNKNTHKYTVTALSPEHNSYQATKESILNKLTYKCNARNEEFDESKCYVWVRDYDPVDFDYDPMKDSEKWAKWETD